MIISCPLYKLQYITSNRMDELYIRLMLLLNTELIHTYYPGRIKKETVATSPSIFVIIENITDRAPKKEDIELFRQLSR